MSFAKEIANLISVRTYLSNSIDNLNLKMSREELKAVQAKVVGLDKLIIKLSLELDLSKVSEAKYSSSASIQVNSTENVDDVMKKVVVKQVAQGVNIPNTPVNLPEALKVIV